MASESVDPTGITEPKPFTGDGAYHVGGMPHACRFRSLELAVQARALMVAGQLGEALDLWYQERGHTRATITASKRANFSADWLSAADRAHLGMHPLLREEHHYSSDRMRR